ncbi:MAG TPA: hypothetical protein VH643_40435 [Gemmataceae bacterium]
MISSSVRNTSRPVPTHTARFTRWGGWLGFFLLAGHLIFCHGCHGDEDNELCVPQLKGERPRQPAGCSGNQPADAAVRP